MGRLELQLEKLPLAVGQHQVPLAHTGNWCWRGSHEFGSESAVVAAAEPGESTNGLKVPDEGNLPETTDSGSVVVGDGLAEGRPAYCSVAMLKVLGWCLKKTKNEQT
jgi:hypothetical protein